ncbi:hypothetical protein IAT38_002915 [Cryptococcus sp. DSM 104549]
MKLPLTAQVLLFASAATSIVEVQAHSHGHGLRERRSGREGHERMSRDLERDLARLDPLPPEVQVAVEATEEVLLPRADTSNATTNGTATATTSNGTVITLPLSPSVTPTSAPSPIPTPLDLSISTSLSSSCMIYLASLVSSSTFLSCLPFSLLLTTSTAYSSLVARSLSSGNYTTLNELIAYTANPQPSGGECESYMQGVAGALAGKANCAADVSGKVPVAMKAKLGVGNYAVMKEAEALVNATSGRYCYLEAIASERPDDMYLWGLPGGISLPSSSKPSCSSCSALLLNTYLAYTPTTSTLNATVINSAAKRVNEACGASFVNFSTAAAANSSSGAGRLDLGSGAGLGLLVVGMAVGWGAGVW